MPPAARAPRGRALVQRGQHAVHAGVLAAEVDRGAVVGAAQDQAPAPEPLLVLGPPTWASSACVGHGVHPEQLGHRRQRRRGALLVQLPGRPAATPDAPVGPRRTSSPMSRRSDGSNVAKVRRSRGSASVKPSPGSRANQSSSSAEQGAVVDEHRPAPGQEALDEGGARRPAGCPA